jgi:hypothetical protein
MVGLAQVGYKLIEPEWARRLTVSERMLELWAKVAVVEPEQSRMVIKTGNFFCKGTKWRGLSYATVYCS